MSCIITLLTWAPFSLCLITVWRSMSRRREQRQRVAGGDFQPNNRVREHRVHSTPARGHWLCTLISGLSQAICSLLKGPVLKTKPLFPSPPKGSCCQGVAQDTCPSTQRSLMMCLSWLLNSLTAGKQVCGSFGISNLSSPWQPSHTESQELWTCFLSQSFPKDLSSTSQPPPNLLEHRTPSPHPVWVFPASSVPSSDTAAQENLFEEGKLGKL